MFSWKVPLQLSWRLSLGTGRCSEVFTERALKHQTRLLREAAESPSQQYLNDMVLRKISGGIANAGLMVGLMILNDSLTLFSQKFHFHYINSPKLMEDAKGQTNSFVFTHKEYSFFITSSRAVGMQWFSTFFSVILQRFFLHCPFWYLFDLYCFSQRTFFFKCLCTAGMNCVYWSNTCTDYSVS